MFQFLVFSTLLLSNGIYVKSFTIPIISDIQEMISLAADVQSVWAGNVPFKNLVTEVENPATMALEKLDKLSDQVSSLAMELTDKMDNIVEQLMTKIPLAQELSTAMRDFANIIVRVDMLYDDFKDFVGEDGINSYTLDTIVKSVTSRDSGDIPEVINQMHALFVPGRSASIRESILNLMLKAKEGTEDSCNPAFSFQERLYEIFNIVSLTEIRAFMMTMFAYDYLATKTNESYAKEVKKIQAKFVMRMEEYILTVKKKMNAVSRLIYTCDPPSWVRGETFVELEGLFTGYLIHEQQAFSTDTCSYRCDEIDTKQTYRCHSWKVAYGYVYEQFEYCQVKKCLGRAYWCGEIAADVEVCEYPESSRQRYKYVKGTSTYGSTAGGCSGNGLKKSALPSITVINKCTPCFCRCVETAKDSIAVRAVSFQPQIADTEKDMVITNFRFTEKYNMIHIQVEQSQLLPELRVNENVSNWIPLEDYTYKRGYFYRDSDNRPLREDFEYAFINDVRRTFHLDDILLPPNHVLTGLRLNNVIAKSETGPVQIEAHATPVADFNKGKLDSKNSIWVTATSQPTPHKRYTEKRTEVDYGKKVDPRKSKENYVFSKINEFVMFGPSNVQDDAAQTTIPLFDAQPVTVNRTSALGGIGMYVRGAKDYGGFIALRTYTANMADYMNPNMRKKQLKNFKKLYRDVLAYDPPVVG